METIEVLPIRVRVTAILRKSILSGEIKAGSEMSLTDTAARLGVSRTPVREAFQTLAAEGLLELRMNKGAIVIGIDEKTIQDHFFLRILLEGEAAAQAACNKGDVTELFILQEDAEKDTMDEKAYRYYNQKIHTELWKMADNDKMTTILTSLWNGPSRVNADTSKQHERLSVLEHRRILECVKSGDVDGAREAMRGHLERSRDNLLKSFNLN